jgi:hypothetical protein
MTDSGLVTVLKDRLNKFTYDIVDEDLAAENDTYKQYNSVNTNWVSSPPPSVRAITIAGVETVILPATYAVNQVSGYITLNVARAATDVVRADYSFFPFTDAQLLDIVDAAIAQVQVLIGKTVSPSDIPANYQEAVLKKAYVLALREMQFPTIKYFTISVGGETMGKENQVTMINAMIESIEKELLPEINALRLFDRTNVLT